MSRATFLLLCLVFAGCASPAYRRAVARDSIDGWRAFLASQPDRGDEIDHARERLETLSWKATLAEDTPRAYRRFADDFPDSEHHDEAEARLAALRYRSASAASGLAGFLEDEPSGPLADSARKRLADLEFTAAIKAPGSTPLELYLARFPEGPHVAEVKALLDQRDYESAAARGPLGLAGYLDKHPDGRHRAEAEDALAADQVRALIEEERFDEAQNALRAAGRFAGKEGLEAQLAAARQRARLAAVDAVPGLGRTELERLQEWAFALARPHRTAVAQLATGLDAADPARRWTTAEELARTGSIWALDPLLAAASSSHFFAVRLAAAAAVRELAAGWSATVRSEEVSRRLLELRRIEAGAELSDRVGLLEELAGDVGAARAAFAQSRRWAPDDLIAVSEGMRLAREAGDEVGRLELARDLAAIAGRYADDRLRDEGWPPLLADRQLCGLDELARAGVAELAASGPSGAAWLPGAQTQQRRVADLLDAAERQAALEDPAFVPCASAKARPADEAVTRRLAAVAALAQARARATGAEAATVQAILEEAAARDGSSEVRRAAREALGAPGTVAPPATKT